MNVQFPNFAGRYDDLRQILTDSVCHHPERIAYIELPPNAEPIKLNYRDLLHRINALGAALEHPCFAEKKEDFNPAEMPNLDKRRLAILGDNSIDWIIAQNAALFGAGLAVPLDKQLSGVEMSRLLERARCRKIFIDAGKYELIDYILQNPGTITDLILIGHAAPKVECTHAAAYLAETEDETCSTNELSSGKNVRIWRIAELEEYGSKRLAAGKSAFPDTSIDPTAPAAIFFTSGTTAASKGVMLSHRNISHVEYICRTSIDLPCDGAVLSVLPLHHTLENSAQYVMWSHHQTVVFNNGLRYIGTNLKKFPIVFVVTVPLLLDNIKRQIEHNVAKLGKMEKFEFMRRTCRRLLRLGIDLRPFVFKKVRKAVGPALSTFIVGAAALKPETETFFQDLGFNVFVGYGLTETAPILTCNSQKLQVQGSVGGTATGVELRIDADGDGEGEVFVRCPNLMIGYYEDEAATKAAIDEEGWFHTGDVGYLDAKGALFITGRVKSMIVLTNGKKVFPEEVESLFEDQDLIDQVMIFGGKSKRDTIDVCALLRLRADQVGEAEELPAECKAKIEAEIARINSIVPPYKSIKYWTWTTDNFVMTSTLKVKREPTMTKLLKGLGENEAAWREVSGHRVKLR